VLSAANRARMRKAGRKGWQLRQVPHLSLPLRVHLAAVSGNAAQARRLPPRQHLAQTLARYPCSGGSGSVRSKNGGSAISITSAHTQLHAASGSLTSRFTPAPGL
jgi:hypothetical protein